MIPSRPWLTGVEHVNWDDTGSILGGCAAALDAIAGDPRTLAALLASLEEDRHLQGMCERYDFLDKLVLCDLPEPGVRVRLHLYRDGYFDRPHNHRWSFASRIIRGQYVHRVFGQDTDFTEDTDPASLRPIYERIEAKGATYALHHASVHTVQATEGTISLLIRGPAARDRFLILDRAAGSPFWVYGAASETPAQRASKVMTPPALTEVIGRIRALTGLTPAATKEARA